MHNPGENFSQSNIPNDNPWENLSADLSETVSDEGLTLSAEETGEQEPSQLAELREATANKTKKHEIAKKVLLGVAALAAVISLVGCAAPKESPNDKEKTISEYENELSQEITRDGYDAKGMWLSENKSEDYNFACANEVRQVCNNDDIEMVKYTARNQSESFADYLAGLPQELQLDGLKNMNILDTEKALDQLSDDEYKQTVKEFENIMDRAQVRDVVLYGSYDNAFMRLKNSEADADYKNMELVRCATPENGTMAKEYYWLDDNDGHEIGSMTIKAGRDGCMQLVTRAGSSHIYENLPEVPTPTPTPPTPTPEIIPKDSENLQRIDNQINRDIAEDVGTGKINIAPTQPVSRENLTEKPASSQYDGIRPTIIENQTSQNAETVTPQNNNYSENRGGANVNPETNYVQDNTAAQEEANRRAEEVINNGVPTSPEDLSDDYWAQFGL